MGEYFRFFIVTDNLDCGEAIVGYDQRFFPFGMLMQPARTLDNCAARSGVTHPSRSF
ncbi:MAG TPA: hypothetical protein IGS17_14650 [Oscillatoriales cyanobacterium M59_W2019_021]|nr:hypothetical protein [Oscillatoriales cyanobacterium M4454_W2019_049]HIK52144.1 hypothetical protein [Oscillatoriales cyanobacterium M59_W2019_021]